MTAKEEAKEIHDSMIDIWISAEDSIENADGKKEVQLPLWVIKKVTNIMIDRIPHVKDSITVDYWKEVRKEINNLD